MAKPEQPQQQEPRTRREREQPTHLVGQSRTGRSFTRAGVKFEANGYRAVPLDQLSEDQVKRILKETAIDARLCTADEAEEMAAVQAVEFDESVTKRQLIDELLKMRSIVEKQEARMRDLEDTVRRMSADPKPNPTTIVPR